MTAGNHRAEAATVVVVDDDSGNRLALSAVLESLEENVYVFDSGQAALKHLIERPDCAVVILDVQMGAVGGFEVARLLSQRERTRHIPIIFLTGTMGEAALQGYAEGAVDFITKPFDPDALRGKVSGLVKLYKQRRALERERDDSLAKERSARAETASEREYLYRFLAQVPACIARLRGPLHVFEFVNAAYIEAIGHRNPTGKAVREALPELEGQPFFELLDRVYSTGIPYSAREVPVSLARGPGGATETVYMNFVYQPTHGGDGRVDGILVHAVDVTAQAKARQAAEALSTELKNTAEELQRLAAFQRQLLAIVGHDLRNPLGAILANAQSMLKKPRDAATAAGVARIARSARRMNGIINDLLDFTQARLEGGLKVVRETCDIAELCKQVVEELSMVYPGRAIRVESAGSVKGEWDCSRLQQVISNLVANGLQYSARDSEVVVRIEEGPSQVRLQVANRGAPIPGPLLGKLFEPFQRATTEERTGNVGLGLYIVDQLVRAHGGSVEVSSTESAGTTFTVHLPRAA